MESKETFINLTEENLPRESLCCIIRSKKPHPGVERKREWLSDRLKEGHVFRKLDDPKATVFIEYAPLEKAWVPVLGDNFVYIYCLWVEGEAKGKGYGKALMEYCLEDAKKEGKSGVCMLGAKKQKHWLSDQSFAEKFGFKVVDSTDDGYDLLALSFDGSKPRFSPSAKKHRIDSLDLTVYFDAQCPYIAKSVDVLNDYCHANEIPLSLIEVDSLDKAKNLPCVFNNYGVFYQGEFITVNLFLDPSDIQKLIHRSERK